MLESLDVRTSISNFDLEFSFSDYPPIVVAPPPENVGDFDKTGPRLMITHIENDNFKSYAGITVLGPFHKVDSYCSNDKYKTYYAQ